ncbi:glycosyltransferase [Rhabdothermincola salaria]|uniref:glycosyltransferase n=1 Tax=Rhabdothermincola salaria TaxID=2903142 RepID=UPI001E5594AE|nr:glycosyltransferase [Rhabdothermincola salaria]
MSALAVAGWSAGWAAGWFLGWRLPPLGEGARVVALAEPRAPQVAVIVPARDEEASIGALLASVATQTLTPHELVVVDDGSTDATAELAAAAGARVVSAGPVADGWAGKPWALRAGVAATSAPLLVFLDADVTLAPGALDALVGEHAHRGGLVSVLPEHRPHAAYEQWSAPCNLVSVMGTGAAAPGSTGTADGAFGPCLVVRRDDLAAVGGWAAVADEVVEDLALAHRFRAADLPVAALAGGDLVGFRMYPEGPRQLIEGWTKNMAAGATSVPWWRSVLVALWVTAGLAGPLAVLRRRTPRALAVAVLAWLAYSVQFGVLARRVGRFRWWVAPAHPALLGGFAALFARSARARWWTRSVTWRGRQVPVAGGPSGSGRALRSVSRTAILVMRARL